MINEILSVFNPDNDLALANWDANYMPPESARRMAEDLALLPAWYATGGAVLAPSAYNLGFLNEMQELFSLPVRLITAAEDLSAFRVVAPWGWNPALRKRMLAGGIAESVLPSVESLCDLRLLSHRSQAVDLLPALRLGPDFCGESVYLKTMDECRCFVESYATCLLKAPLSGSGKGLNWCKGSFTPSISGWCIRLIEQQGGVVGEPVYNKVEDFAMEFHLNDTGEVSFVGYSLFKTNRSGAYEGNLLLPDEEVERRLSEYVPLSALRQLRLHLEKELTARYGGRYTGFLGVDMMICRFEQLPEYRIHPCVEVNLRMNMGLVAHFIYKRYVVSGASGVFCVAYHPAAREAIREHNAMMSAHPLQVKNGRVVSGYLPLVPVQKASRYRAYVVLYDV